MRKFFSRPLVVVALVVLLVLFVPGGIAIVTVKLVQARGRKAVHDQVADEVARQVAELRPDLTAEQVARIGDILGAQAVLETNGGKTPAWVQGWNWGNVTAGWHAGWDGKPVVQGGDTEYDAAGNVRNITQKFRKYASLAESVSDYLPGGLVGALDWKSERDAGAWEALVSGDANGYVAALRRAGYFTAPLAEYQAGVRGAMA